MHIDHTQYYDSIFFSVCPRRSYTGTALSCFHLYTATEVYKQSSILSAKTKFLDNNDVCKRRPRIGLRQWQIQGGALSGPCPPPSVLAGRNLSHKIEKFLPVVTICFELWKKNSWFGNVARSLKGRDRGGVLGIKPLPTSQNTDYSQKCGWS